GPVVLGPPRFMEKVVCGPPRGETMRMHVRILGVAAVLALGVWFLTGPRGAAGQKGNGWKPVLDEAEAKTLIKRAIDRIQGELKKTPTEKREKRKQMKNIQIRAVMIAVYAESAKAGPEKKLLTAYADAGLKLARAAVVSAKVADVKKLADALAKAKPGANGKLGNVDW